ncbi:MAG: amidohydrolase [Aquamicrobium sp.]|uniref:M20 aminoacylase family protein n=1 Tax=Mesorhizobium sp. Pch-S TaxID=2082387 RepID=UPI00101144A6|nr:M20 aminoacylase family protein [Mesorhizobium sp. Pch-S]MBR2686555.1 amidohydrolase [Aquamicrobium sp.]QAZ42195.1 amidohydrolase [Mesorhizobium sp. Pch-S]
MTETALLEREMTAWRRDLHAHPEFGFEEKRTAAFVAAKLREFGIDDVTEGVGGTGVVGTLRRGSSNRAIALRADMDALRISEQGMADYRSQNPGVMHACGHDGHTAMLLGAARRLVEEGGFDGTVRFIFQPAEEWGKGALAMLDDGLMARFPFEEIYGLHNMPGLPIGHFETRAGSFMSAEDNFEIVLKGVGGHAARPHWGNEVLVAACALVTNLQTIVSRRLSPTDIGVVSVTELITDGTRNALPGLARILGDARSFRPEVSAEIERQMRIIAEGTALAHNVGAEVIYTREFVPLVNDAALVEEAFAAAATVFEPGAIATAREPMTGSEDFARFLDHVPGCFVFVGNGETSAPLHNPTFDFNDAGLLYGAGFHVAITRRRLPERQLSNSRKSA